MHALKVGWCLFLASLGGAVAAEPGAELPWWKQQKICFMWGQWNHAREDRTGDWWGSDLPRQLFRNVALAGGTVFVECRGYKPRHARYAHEFGLKYFATLFVCDLSPIGGGRKWVKEDEEHWWPCPLEESIYRKWIVEPHLEGVQAGLIDGLHFDWEPYGGRGEASLCFCDDCFSTFLTAQGLPEDRPDKLQRLKWLTDHGLVDAYQENFHLRRGEMFTRIRETLQAVRPDLVFSSYNMLVSDFSQAMNTPEVPFIVCDARHYYNHNRQPWWESYGAKLRELGYLYIPGGWTNALFGAQASDVSAARWIYEASINEDGCWLWFERELDDEILRAYAAANRKIRAVERRVGRFLFRGERDPNFVTAVEWTGRPELERAVIPGTYHLGEEHLVHVNNVDCDWPLRVRLRFPRLPPQGPWTVRDPMNDLYYTHDGSSAVWTADHLRAGVVVAMEPRSDLFLLLSPAAGDFRPDTSSLVPSREFSTLPDHTAASAQAGPIKAMIQLYVMKNAIYGQDLEALLAAAEKWMDLPTTGWYFKMDPEDLGPGQSWFRPETPGDDWAEIEMGSFWGDQGGTGPGWYRGNVEVPALPEGRRVYLHFGAVDEELVLWIDGQYAGDYNRGPDGWDQPFAFDVTGKLTAGTHHLALRVFNSSAAGGIWKPISVWVGPATPATVAPGDQDDGAAGPSGRLVYTAAEPMGLAGPEAGLTLGNTVRTIDADGDNHLRLRQVRGHLWSPAWSPDGQRIAFVHDAGGRGQIYVMNADGSEAKNISGNAFCDRSPVWSPDGARIAFVSDRSGDWDLYTMLANGGKQKRLAGNPGLDRAPAWSPDGARIAWESHVSGMPNLWVCRADGADPHPIIQPGQPPVIKEVRPDGMVEVEPLLPSYEFYLTHPVWSPDGQRIAGVGLSGNQMVFVLEADGSSLLQVIPWIPFADDLCWSPDGTRIAGSWRCAPQETERSGIFVVGADGSDKRFLVDVTPTGPRLGGARRHGLRTWYTHGSAQPRRVVKTFSNLAWPPDGQTLAFSSDLDPSGAFYIYTISPAGGPPKRLDETRSAWLNQIGWRPN